MQWGPPRQEAWLGDYAAGHGLVFEKVFSPQQHPATFPNDQHGAAVRFTDLPREYPAVGVLALPGGIVAGTDGAVVDPNGTYLIDANIWFHDYLKTPTFGFGKKLSETRLDGVTVSFLTLWGNTNYYHFLVESIPRIAILLASSYGWDDVDHVLLPPFTGKSGAEVLAALPIPREKVRHVAFGEHVHCETLIATSFPGAPCVAPRWACDFLRSLNHTAPSRSPARIYIRRGNERRGLTNEPEVERVLQEEFGFHVLDYTTAASEMSLMAGADVIVGPHGAGLSKLVFAQTGAAVVELINPAWRYPFYWTLATSSGHRYHPILGRARGAHASGQQLPHVEYTVDLEAVRFGVEQALAPASVAIGSGGSRRIAP